MLGWIGNTLIIGGTWLLGYKYRAGFVATIAGGLLWAFEGCRIGRADLVCVNMVLALVAVRNFFKWRET